MSQMHALIAGLGSIGNRHLNNLMTLGVKRITVLRRPGSNPHFGVPPGVNVVHDVASAIECSPSFAVVCTPSSRHVSLAVQLISHGTPCLIEKPLHDRIDASVNELAEISAASIAGQLSGMAYCMRFHRAYAMAAGMLAGGELGRCIYGKAWFEGYLPEWHPWENFAQSYAASNRLGGGALRTLDHEIDFMNWSLGRAVESTGLTANVGGIQIEADEVAHLCSRHNSGCSSQICLALCRKPPSRGFEFVCQNGVLRYCLESKRLKVCRHAGNWETLLNLPETETDRMYLELLREFVQQIQTGKASPLIPGVEAGINSLRIIDACRETANPWPVLNTQQLEHEHVSS